MAIAIIVELPGATQSEYEAARKIIGEPNQPGQLAHLSGPMENGWRVVDVWESEEALGAFLNSETATKAFQVAGWTIPQPILFPVHTFVSGANP